MAIIGNYNFNNEAELHQFFLDLIDELPDDSNRESLLMDLESHLTDAVEQSEAFERKIDSLREGIEQATDTLRSL